MIRQQRQKGPNLIDPALVAKIIQSVRNERIQIAISMYYTLLDQEMFQSVIEPKEKWTFRPIKIEPMVHRNDSEIFIGAVVYVGFMCELFHDNYVPAFEINVINRLDMTNQCQFSGEIRRDIMVDLVKDEDLSEFKLVQRKVFQNLKEVIEDIWVSKVIPSVASPMGKNGSPPARQPAAESSSTSSNPVIRPPVSMPMETATPVMGAMSPTLERPSLLHVDDDDDFDIPMVGDMNYPSKTVQEPVQKQQLISSLPEEPEDPASPESPLESDEDDIDDDIDIQIAGRVPSIDDDDPPSFSPQMMKKDS